MTFGIDIASPQRDIDLARANAEGVEFVVVKMGGLNVTPQYVAPNYAAQVDRAVAAGLPKGHYYLIGKGQTPEQQAEFFVANLYKFDPERDILALDNEALDSNGTRWTDADAARFAWRVLELTRIPVSRFWHYAGARDYRASTWPELSKLGVRFWWAAYGDYPTGHTPDHTPDLQGSIPRWDIHQYSSRVAVAGYSLDGNYTPHTVADLFGGGTVPLNNYVLRAPATVIADDDRDPYVSWQHHLERTQYQRGGVDLVASVGTPVYARTAGRMIQIPDDGSAGNSCRFYHRDNTGWKDVFSHLSSYRTPKNPTGANAFDYEAGDIVAYTGNSGGVTEHLHWHLLDAGGTRRNPWDYFSGTAVAGGGTTPIEEDDMFTDADRNQLSNVWKMLITGAEYNGQKWNYGVLPIVAHNQTLIAQQSGRIAALESAVSQLAVSGGGSIDIAAVEEAARAGAAEALAGLGFPTVEQIASAVNDEAADRLAS